MPARQPNQRKADRDVAFSFWYADGAYRTHREVAAEFGVSQHAVEIWASEEDWNARAIRLDGEARGRLEKQMAKRAAERIRQNLELIRATKAVYARQLADGKKAVSPTELVALIKAEQLLTGGVTERTSDASVRDESQRAVLEAVADELGGLSVEQLEAEEGIDP